MEVRLQEIERQLQMLTGRVEELTYANGQLGSRLDRALNDVEYRLSTLEGGGAVPGAAAPGAGTAPGGPGAVGGVAGATRSGQDNSAAGTGPTSTQGTLGTLNMGTAGAGQATTQPGTPTPPPAAAQGVALPDGPPDAQYNYAYGLLAQGNYDGAEQALTQFLQANGDSPLASNAQYWLGETYYIRG
ncbi:MAG TPA: tetratricopeptide repeat protein, partial [Thalassobaculum sp.]